MMRVGFQNPWPSWHKPTLPQVWQGLEWGEDQDPAIPFAMQQAAETNDGLDSFARYRDEPESESDGLIEALLPTRTRPPTREQQLQAAAQKLLKVQQPDFALDPSATLKATWLGHAGVLVQLAPLQKNHDPIRILFDPIFSQRCSPSQIAGPIRSYAAPCPIAALPPIDLIFSSHNHYDHLDYDTIKQLWELNKDRVRFVVPLGNKNWFIGKGQIEVAGSAIDAAPTSALGIPEDRVTELDWWDEVCVSGKEADDKLRIVCTPAQHGSGRYGVDTNCALWSSWFVEHVAGAKSTKIFFGGDTGCQFHEGDFPPAPRPDDAVSSPPTFAQYPACPAFDEIVARLGSPDFLMLPVSVGATISFLRSYIPLPDAYSPFPRLSTGLTAANHMPPWDAVSVFDRMTQGNPDAVCLAIHWGTFIAGPEEVLKTLGQLEWACRQHNVTYARSLDTTAQPSASKTFIALDHGASTSL